MVSGRGTPPSGTPPRMEEDDDDLVEEEEDGAYEVIELDDDGDGDRGDDADDDRDEDDENEERPGEIMDDDDEENDDDSSDGMLFDPPAVDDAAIVFSGHAKSVFTVAVDPTGSVAVSGGEDDKAFVWKVIDGSVLFECKGHEDSVVCVAFNHDGSMVATGDMAGAIKVWKVSSGKQIWSFECSDLEWLFWHPVASVIVAGTIDGSSWMWKIPSGECKTYSGPNCPSSVGRLHPDGKRLCVGYGDGSCRIWDLKNANVLHTIGDLHTDNVTCMDVHRDGNVLLTGSVDRRARLLNPNNGKVVATLPVAKSGDGGGSSAAAAETDDADSVEAVCLSPSLPLAATGALSGRLLIWDLNAEKLRHDPITLDGGVTRLAWHSGSGGGGDLLFCSSLDGAASAWDGRTGNVVRRWTGHRGQILDMAVSPLANFILTSSSDATVRSFSLQSS